MTGRSSPLSAQVTTGVVWVSVAAGAGRLLTLFWLALLARALVPEDFGLMTSALAILLLLETVTDLGLITALIRWPNRYRDAAQVTFVLHLAMSLLWLLLVWSMADPLGRFFRRTDVAPILMALAWALPLRALGATHDALCQKELRFGARLLPEILLPLVKGGLAFFLARRGFGAWSLVWGHLAGHAAWSASLWLLVPFRPSLRLPREVAWPMWRYGRGILAVNALAAVLHHADLLVVGRFLGATALGLYQLAYKIPEMTLLLLARVLSRVLFPAFSKVQQDPERLQRGYLLGLRSLGFIAIPLATALTWLAEPLVVVTFGPRWSPAAPLLRVLAVYFCIRALSTNAGDVLKAIGRSGLLAGLGALKASVLLPALALGVQRGPTGVAWGMAVTGIFSSLVNFMALSVANRLSLRRIGGALLPGIGGGTLVATSLAVVLNLLSGADSVTRLFVGGAVAAVLWCLLSVWLAPELWRTLRTSFGWVVRRRPSSDDSEDGLLRCGRFLFRHHDAVARQLLLASWLAPRRRRERVGKALLRAFGFLTRGRTGSQLTAVALGADRHAGLSTLAQTALEVSQRAELLAALAEPQRPGCWLLRQSVDGSERQQVVLALLGDDGAPRAVLKARPAGTSEASLASECEALLSLEEGSLTDQLGIPRCLVQRRFGDLDVVLLSVVPGASVYVEMQSSLRPRRIVGHHLSAAASWLARLHACTQDDASQPVGIEDFEEHWPRARHDLSDEWVERLAAALAKRPILRCRCHGDFWPGNLIVDRGTPAGAIDWGKSEPMTLPFDDLFLFPISYLVNASWQRSARLPVEVALSRALLGGGFRRHVSAYFRHYAEATSLELDTIEAAFRWWVAGGGLRALTPHFHSLKSVEELERQLSSATAPIFGPLEARRQTVLSLPGSIPAREGRL